MHDWIPKNKIVKFAAITVFFSAVLYFGSLFIVLKEMQRIENSYRNTESQSYKEEKIRAVKSITEAKKEQIKILQDFFIKKENEVEFIEQIETVARSTGIRFEINSIDAQINQKDLFKEDIKIKIKMEGAWLNIMRFVNKLEKMPFGILITDIDLNTQSVNNWSGLVEFIVFREK